MPLRLKGVRPAVGETDRRVYMIDVQSGHRRERLSSGTRDKALALRREQIVLDAIQADPSVTKQELKALVRGSAYTTISALRRANETAWNFKQACDLTLADRKGHGKSKGWALAASKETYATNCRMLQKVLGQSKPVASIDQETVDDLVETLADSGNSPATINRKLFCLLAVLRFAKRAGQYHRDIPHYRQTSEADSARLFTLTVAEEAELFSAFLKLDERPEGPAGGHPIVRDAADYHDVLVFLADIGCRHAQAYKVTWRDVVEIEAGVAGAPNMIGIRFWRAGEQKGGKTRTTPATDRVRRILERRRALGGRGPFMGLNKRRAQALWSLAKKETSLADEPECVIHSLRHTCATRLLNKTGNLKLVQEWLGHTKIETTGNIYAKALISTKVEALSALQGFTPGTSPIAETQSIQDHNSSHIRDNTITTH
ncbi:tyrosine-type recombinase/integrase [Lysobacter sp. Hz 25]|uniref:tyrosine-type recombinase/integrase n=1 Tax=Lysobacter sp. Hz 25 TaxID=3383698 RepID=UPI0038D4C3CD